MSGADLLAAGAVLPLGTTDAGEQAVPLTVRSYRHPALDDRIVVRLVAEELGAAEDQAVGFLGLTPDAEPEVVGLGQRQALGFPEWVLVHHPADGHHALAVVPELERIARQARSKPGNALDAYQALAAELAVAVPHFLPTFFEQAGRVFLGVENTTYAARMFTRARTVEAEFGLPLDADRLDAVFLEFALAGALPVKTLSAYAKDLARRLPAAEAFQRFRRLCVRRTAGGLAPSTQTAADLRRMARAAGADVDAEERAYLRDLLALPGTLRAPYGWWKAHRAALVALARQDPAVRGTLLTVMPSGDTELVRLWLEILTDSGATAGLTDPTRPAEERPGDGSAGWLERFLSFRGYWRAERMPALLHLVEQMADVLRAELAASGRTLKSVGSDVDLLDLLLTHQVPVADTGGGLALEQWARGEGQRDLRALHADGRFQDSFRSAADSFGDDADARRAIRMLADSPGGRPMLADWVRRVASRSAAEGLPQLPGMLYRLSWLPGEALALAEDEVRAVAATDLAPVLARTLRAGLLDELSWPAFEQAATELVARNGVTELVVADAWPYLVVAGPTQVRVIDADGTVLRHDLRTPDTVRNRWNHAGFHYVDGALLVYWNDDSGRTVGYWHTAADRPQPLNGDAHTRGITMYYSGPGRLASTLPLPGGGRTTGAGVLHRGDAAVPDEAAVIGDGTAYWVLDPEQHHQWREYDPVTGARGRHSLPGFLADALRDAPAGSTFQSGWQLPVRTGDGGSIVGWRVVRLPDGALRGEDPAGHRIALAPRRGTPCGALPIPGADRALGVYERGPWEIGLVDADGVVVATAKTDNPPGEFAAGTPILPPERYWHCLRPRDPQGSLALRGIDHATTTALLTAAGSVPAEQLPAAIRTLLPQVSDDDLLAGIAGVARIAARQQAALDATAKRLTAALAGEEPHAPAGPPRVLPLGTLSGLIDDQWRYNDDRGIVARLTVIGQEAVAAQQERPQLAAGRTHLDGSDLPWGAVELATIVDGAAAIAYRAAAPTTTQPDRETLLDLLRDVDAPGLASTADSGRWRWVSAHLDQSYLEDRQHVAWSGVLRLPDGAFVVFLGHMHSGTRYTFDGLFHDPTGRFELPPPYEVASCTPVGAPRASGWLTALRTELAERGPAPWFPAAADQFAELTGVTPTVARLVVAGMPNVGEYRRTFLPTAARTLLEVKQNDAVVAKDQLRRLEPDVRRQIVGALLPADPARLWTDGPDVAAAAAVWNEKVGRRPAIPEALLHDATRSVHTGWELHHALPALLDPAADPHLSRDLGWRIHGDRAVPVDPHAAGFTATILVSTVTLLAWLAHRLPAGDPMRAALPRALSAVRDRLANPELLLDLRRYISLPSFRQAAGAPTETGTGFERYGAVILATHDNQPAPALRTALLDASGDDPYLAALRGVAGEFEEEIALRLAGDPRFAALLADPGAPAAGEPGADGTWWPQDPTRSVPDLVAEVAAEHGIGADAAAVYLMVLAMPDPVDRNTARWTGWKPARLKAARAELAGTDLVVEATRTRAGRSLFLPGGWTPLHAPLLPTEQWKLPLYDALLRGPHPRLGIVAPTEPVADLYRRAWQRLRDGDVPRFEELPAKRARRR